MDAGTPREWDKIDVGLSSRLQARVSAAFPDDRILVMELLATATSGGQDRGRVLAAIVLRLASRVSRMRPAALALTV